jgi:hypothetical protein
MADIYARQRTVHAGSFPSDQAAMSLAGTPIAMGIIQGAQVSFAQAISRLYDVSNGGFGGGAGGLVPVYYVGGRTQGQGQLSRVMGPQSGALCEFYRIMGNVCSPQDLTFTFRSGCGQAGATTLPNSQVSASSGLKSVAYTLESVVMNNVGISVDSQAMIVNDNVGLIFSNMRCSESLNN